MRQCCGARSQPKRTRTCPARSWNTWRPWRPPSSTWGRRPARSPCRSAFSSSSSRRAPRRRGARPLPSSSACVRVTCSWPCASPSSTWPTPTWGSSSTSPRVTQLSRQPAMALCGGTVSWRAASPACESRPPALVCGSPRASGGRASSVGGRWLRLKKRGRRGGRAGQGATAAAAVAALMPAMRPRVCRPAAYCRWPLRRSPGPSWRGTSLAWQHPSSRARPRRCWP